MPRVRAGTATTPFKTIAAAVSKAASIPAPRTVFLAGTTVHEVHETVVLTPQHSSTTIMPANSDSSAVVSGGVSITPTWTKTDGLNPDNSTTYTTTVPAGLAFIELFTAANARYVPARHPNGNPELDDNNFGLRASGWLPAVDFQGIYGNATVIENTTCDGLAGVPPYACSRGGRLFGSYRTGLGGAGHNWDPPTSYWAQPHPAGGGATACEGAERTRPGLSQLESALLCCVFDLNSPGKRHKLGTFAHTNWCAGESATAPHRHHSKRNFAGRGTRVGQPHGRRQGWLHLHDAYPWLGELGV